MGLRRHGKGNGMEHGESALDVQVGGNHYKQWEIQPIEYIIKNRLNFLQGCIIKRITRYDQSGGKGLEDLEKIKHEVDLLIELEGWGNAEG